MPLFISNHPPSPAWVEGPSQAFSWHPAERAEWRALAQESDTELQAEALLSLAAVTNGKGENK